MEGIRNMWPIPAKWSDVLDERQLERVWHLVEADSLPPRHCVLRAFTEVAPEDVRCVILGQDPYHTPGTADGLAFSASNDRPCPPSLRNIFTAIHEQTGHQRTNCRLDDWAEQGVMLLNTALTVAPRNAGSHLEHWAEVIQHVIAHLRSRDQPIVWLLWGRHAQQMFGPPNSNPKHLTLHAPHPSPLNGRLFVDHERRTQSFLRTNSFLLQHNSKTIQWC